MQKSKSLSKILVVGGMAIALLAPIAVSSTATNLIPNTTINVQAKGRHYYDYYNSFRGSATRRAKYFKRYEMQTLKRRLKRHHSKKERKHLRRILYKLRHTSPYTTTGKVTIYAL